MTRSWAFVTRVLMCSAILIGLALVPNGAARSSALGAEAGAPSWVGRNPLPQGNSLAGNNGGAAWTSRTNPLPRTSASLSGVSCPSTRVCVAVGAGGTIVRSGDGGRTWTGQTSGTTEDLLGVSCASADRCVAVGLGSTILRSGNGGLTWSSQASGTTEDLVGVSWPSPLTGAVAARLQS